MVDGGPGFDSRARKNIHSIFGFGLGKLGRSIIYLRLCARDAEGTGRVIVRGRGFARVSHVSVSVRDFSNCAICPALISSLCFSSVYPERIWRDYPYNGRREACVLGSSIPRNLCCLSVFTHQHLQPHIPPVAPKKMAPRRGSSLAHSTRISTLSEPCVYTSATFSRCTFGNASSSSPCSHSSHTSHNNQSSGRDAVK